ncbi:phage tail sheath family protein [Ancylobacter sonchi]|nr:phage tail sheath family protein [Ancylobacter sonchi]
MNEFSSAYVVSVVNAASELVTVTRPAAAASAAAVANGNGTSTSGTLAQADIDRLDDGHRRLAITLDGDGPYEFDLFDAGGELTGDDLGELLGDAAARIQAQVRLIRPSAPAFSGFTCTAGATSIIATSGTADGQGQRSSVRFSRAGQRNATDILKLGTLNGGREVDAAAAIRPAQTGTVGTSIAALDLSTLAQPASINVTLLADGVANDGPHTVELWGAAGRPTTTQGLVSALQSALAGSSKAELSQARVTLADGRLRLVPGGANPAVRLSVSNNGANTTGATLGLNGGAVNVARYALGVGSAGQAQADPVPGDDGAPPSPTQLVGSRGAKSGLYALEDVDLFNILCVPDQSDDALLAAALDYARERRAFYIADLPRAVDTLDEARNWLNGHGALRDSNIAVYFPRLQQPDPLDGNRLKSFANSGAMAGLYARTDNDRGVWKAPAGTDAVLRGVMGLDYVMTDAENGVLNPLGMNCLRNRPGFGPVAWGARTLRGSDQLASEWKYVPVRRLALFLEESLYRGTQWVVFEPNDEPLWAQIRLNLGAFMNNLFRQGAFQGRSPREAYFVKCDAETTTQNDIDRGIVNIVVGFAPLKPAEFVIIKLQQMAGQIQV